MQAIQDSQNGPDENSTILLCIYEKKSKHTYLYTAKLYNRWNYSWYDWSIDNWKKELSKNGF